MMVVIDRHQKTLAFANNVWNVIRLDRNGYYTNTRMLEFGPALCRGRAVAIRHSFARFIRLKKARNLKRGDWLVVAKGEIKFRKGDV